MQYGTKSVNDISDKQKKILLGKIIDSCISYAGDSYEDFSRSVIHILKDKHLVDYGEKQV